MRLKVMTPDKMLLDKSVTGLNLASKEGSFTILKGHAPLITTVTQAVVKIVDEENDATYLKLNAGTLKVLQEEVTFFIDFGEIGQSKEESEQLFSSLKEQLSSNNESASDDALAKLEMEILKRASELNS